MGTHRSTAMSILATVRTQLGHVGVLPGWRRGTYACAAVWLVGLVLLGCATPEPVPHVPDHWIAESAMTAPVRSGDFEVVVRVADLPDIEALSRADMRPYGSDSMADSDGTFGVFSRAYVTCPFFRPCVTSFRSYPTTRLLAAALSKQWVLQFVEREERLTLRVVDRTTWAACDYETPPAVWRDLLMLTSRPPSDPPPSKGRSSNVPPRRAVAMVRTEDLKRAIQRDVAGAPFPGRVTACRDAG